MKNFQAEKALVWRYYADLESASPTELPAVLQRYCASAYQWRGVHPFNALSGSDAVAATVWQPLYDAFQPPQRRQDVFFAGTNEIDGTVWVISMGHIMGLFDRPWLNIPAHSRIAMLRYAEFHCVANGQIIQTAFFCDLIDLMHQVGIRPLPAETGVSFVYPGPRTHDGLLLEDQDPTESAHTLELINRMIADLDELNRSGNDRCSPELLARTWHEDMVWYGPAGIGASYTIPRYQAQHQFPFREGLKDKVFNGHVCRLAEGNYAGFFGWPNLTNTAAGGFLGLPGNDVRADMRVVDIYRRQGSRLAENWVFIDLPHWLLQQGLDVLDRGTRLQGTPTPAKQSDDNR